MLAAFNFAAWIDRHAQLRKPPVANHQLFQEAEDLIVKHIVSDLPPLFDAFHPGARKCPQCAQVHPGRA